MEAIKALVYKTNGEVESITPENGKYFSLKEMQGICDGVVDIQELPKSNRLIILNDEGKLIGLPINEKATEVWKREYPIAEYPHNNYELIVGNVIVCDKSMVQ